MVLISFFFSLTSLAQPVALVISSLYSIVTKVEGNRYINIILNIIIILIIVIFKTKNETFLSLQD